MWGMDVMLLLVYNVIYDTVTGAMTTKWKGHSQSKGQALYDSMRTVSRKITYLQLHDQDIWSLSSIQLCFLKWPKWMSLQGPLGECILLNIEMR